MQTSNFDYELPLERIAQVPATPRDSSRLLILDRKTGAITHRIFRNIGEYLRPGDLLVVNRSRVIPARLFGHKAGSGGKVEALLLRREADGCWQALLKPGRRIPAGTRLIFEGQQSHPGAAAPILHAQVLERSGEGWWRLRFEGEEAEVRACLATIGNVPLPPYIHEPLADAERYQTVYASTPGSVAAPTAGLHFTPELLAALKDGGISVAEVTLHIGLDTFRPLEVENLADHHMHSEYIELDAATADRISATRAAGGRIVAVGTTSVRVLESAAQRALTVGPKEMASSSATLTASSEGGPEEPFPYLVIPFTGSTDLFITPGYRFRAVDVLLTNFHLPRSTLLVLVSAFAGRDLLLRAYNEAMAQGYRFYSFGDAMLLL